VEAHRTEIDYAVREIDYILAHLDDRLKPQPRVRARTVGDGRGL
jgi:hypothetical protein